MAIVTKWGNANPIYCKCCGSTYQWEYGDEIIVVEAQVGFDKTIMLRKLECPNCHYENDITFIKENEKCWQNFK